MNLIDQVKQLIKDHPDRIYQGIVGCRYTSGQFYEEECEESGCLLGIALQSLYPDKVEIMKEMDTETTGVQNFMASCGIKHNLSPSDFKWLNLVQRYQDAGEPWAAAKDRADSLLYKGAKNETV